MQTQPEEDLLRFGPFTLWTSQRRVERHGIALRLGHRTFDLLLHLVRNAGEYVDNEALLANVWAGRVVEEGSVRVHMSGLRKALGLPGPEDGCTEWISNVPQRGYRFNGTVRAAAHGERPAPRPVGRLLGREGELAALNAVAARMRESRRSSLVLIAGPSGIGKSSVARTFLAAQAPSAQVASGKSEQYRRGIPYATLSQALQALSRGIVAQRGADADRWRHRIMDALGSNAALLVRLVPEFATLLGHPPAAAALPPTEAKARFVHVVRELLHVFATSGRPLVVFLDDLQWSDEATLELLVGLSDPPLDAPILWVGAYRDNETGPGHPLLHCVAAIRRAGTDVQTITLRGLDETRVEALVADAVGDPALTAGSLAELVHAKTAGNPFFVLQFVGSLMADRLLRFEVGEQRWRFDLKRIQERAHTENVVALMLSRLTRLGSETREALSRLAAFGSSIPASKLPRLLGRPPAEAEDTLWQAMREALILQQGDRYLFAHDRVQEAAYDLVPTHCRPSLHLSIGRALRDGMGTDEAMQVADQFNLALDLLTIEEERLGVAALDLTAGLQGKASAAYGEARRYFAAGMALLQDMPWTRCHDLKARLWLARAECEYLVGNFDVAERLLDELRQRARSRVEAAAAWRLSIELNVFRMSYPQAVASALSCLRLFGIDMAAEPGDADVAACFDDLWASLAGIPISSLLDRAATDDPEVQAALETLAELYGPALFTNRNLVHLHLCHMVALTLRHGSAEASAPGYAWFGLVVGARTGDFTNGYRFGKLACDLVERLAATRHRAKVQYAAALTAIWAEPVATALGHMRAAHRAAVAGGDLAIACYSGYHIVANLLLRGDPLDEVLQEAELALAYARKCKFADVVDAVLSQQRFIHALQGRTFSLSTFDDATFDEAAFEAHLTSDRMATMVCWYWVGKMQARFIAGDHEQALAAADRAAALLWASEAHIPLLEFHFYRGLVIAALERDGGETGIAAAQRHLAQLSTWAGSGSPLFESRQRLLAAELVRWEGRAMDAGPLYEEAFRAAETHGLVQVAAIAAERAARFHRDRDALAASRSWLDRARVAYSRWGAEGKVLQLD